MSTPTKTTRTVFFTMVMHPNGKWTRVGNSYAKKDTAKGWVPFVKGAWRGCRVKVQPCTLELEDGKLTPASLEILDREYNFDPPR